MPTVYIDLLFLLNFLMNTVTLFSTSLFLGRNLSLIRLSSASTLLALYSTAVFFPPLSFLFSALLKLIVLTLVFPAKKPSVIAKNTLVFFVINAIFGGIIYALIFVTDFGTRVGATVSNGEVYLNISASSLLLSLIPAYLCVYVISHIRRQALKDSIRTAAVTLLFKNKKITLKGFADTGCNLCDPLTKEPAVIISNSAAKRLLPPDFFKAITLGIPVNLRDYIGKYRILPFSTVSDTDGILHAFVPDALTIDGKTINKPLVAIAKLPICENSQFDVLFNPDIIQEPEAITV